MNNPIVSKEEWEKARLELLEKEKEFSKLRDDICEKIRQLPWTAVEKPYIFQGKNGQKSLADLFDGRSQLIVYHFMFGPSWGEGCPACSLIADHYNPSVVHLKQRGVSMVTISRAPLEKLLDYQKRMNWDFQWFSSNENEFNFDFRVSFTPEQITNDEVNYNYSLDSKFKLEEMPGLSVFYKDDAGKIFHTYSTFARGLDAFLGVYRYLDIVPKGRDEDSLPHPMAWVNQHDSYGKDELFEISDLK